jgi:hypothetical protein
MFVINPYLRFALIILGLVGGAALWAIWGPWYGIFFVIAGLVLLGGYIFLGTVGPASKALQAADFEKAEKYLALTLNPRWLYSTNRAYYYMLKGSIALSNKEVEKGEQYLKMAEEIEVPTDNERAMLQIQLAQIAASKSRWKQAKIHYRKAKECKITETAIKDQFKQLEQVINQSGQAKAAMRQGGGRGNVMMGGKGKRRRPKMR